MIDDIYKYNSLPDEAKKTLQAHAEDPRPDLVSFEDIMQGNTSDRTWNAAQREWLNSGWLHNNLRMYWAKQILRFTETPQRAWDLACYLNDYISLDGRDPATYASIQWAFGDGKPGYKEKPIYGSVATKSDKPTDRAFAQRLMELIAPVQGQRRILASCRLRRLAMLCIACFATRYFKT